MSNSWSTCWQKRCHVLQQSGWHGRDNSGLCVCIPATRLPLICFVVFACLEKLQSPLWETPRTQLGKAWHCLPGTSATQAPVPLHWPDCPMCRGRLAVLSKTPSHVLLPAPKSWTPAYGSGKNAVPVASWGRGNCCSCGLPCTVCALLSCSSSEAHFSGWNNWRWL